MKFPVFAAALAAALSAGPCRAGDSIDTRLGRMVLPQPAAPSVATTSSARADYVLHCSGCHGMDGGGLPGKYVPALREIGNFLRVEGGRSFVVQVPGVMGSGLDDRRVAAVANWLLGTMARETVPDGTTPYTPDEVARARARPLVDVAAERAKLVQLAGSRGIALR